MNNTIKIGMRVERIASDYTNGRTGEVFEIDSARNRARVKWAGGHPRTWVSFQSLKILTEVVRGEWIPTPNSRYHKAVRICEKPSAGEVWHEYQK